MRRLIFQCIARWGKGGFFSVASDSNPAHGPKSFNKTSEKAEIAEKAELVQGGMTRNA